MKRTPHLTAGLFAIGLLTLALFGFSAYARWMEARYVNILAPMDLPITLNGSALQAAALRKPDLLPLYGSSELTLLDNSYEATNFFRTYPTGFSVFEVARLGDSALTLAQDLASLGPDLRGRRIVISVTPGDFTMSMEADPYYVDNYSRAHSYAMIFSPYLSLDLKTAAANNMLLHSETLKDDPFLRTTLAILTSSRITRSLYYLLWPLGELQTQILTLQDHYDIVSYIHSHDMSSHVERVPQALDWNSIHAQALAKQKEHTLNNSYGIEDFKWFWYKHWLLRPVQPGIGNKRFIWKVNNHPEWADFQILMQVLQELGARPLILSRPMNVRLWELTGVSESAQNTYYTKLHQVVAPYQFPIVDFQQYGTDIYFSIDQGSHTSREGWIYVDQTLDDFYHNRIR